MVLDRFFCFASRMHKAKIPRRDDQTTRNGRNRFRQVQVERKNQKYPECYLENDGPRCFCEAQKSKAGLVPRAPLVISDIKGDL